jgi:transposase
LLPTVNAESFSAALVSFAEEIGVTATHRVLLVLDGAGFHRAKDVVVPAGIDLWFLPPYSPELQPAERLWALTDTVVANRHFADLDALEDVLAERCADLIHQPAIIQAHTHFHWWADVA